ncbi:hypothetical protein FNF28_05958 [Cafeteria roenbergensis]|uniref:Cwf19-like protein C-terminal domain-containing protein n=1 Tax=Cafeteria roenbergensis TaxID=33653 RepID=A0A5A8D161_CAFRO|nr:hypothetical protein FNF28_05958 [Cafeteria roenbergensis]
MDPFSGMKFQRPGGESTKPPPANAAAGPRAERMSWMNDPAGFASALAARSAPAPKTAEERAEQERLDSARAVVQREIKAGLRDPESGQRYGVTYRRPAGSVSGIEEARRKDQDKAGSSAGGMTEKELFQRMLASAGTASGPFAGASGAEQGDASVGGRMDAGSSSADRLAAKRLREKAARGPSGLEMTEDLGRIGDGRRARKRQRSEDGGGASDLGSDGGKDDDHCEDSGDQGSDFGLDERGRRVALVSGLDSRGVPIRSLERGAAAPPQREDARAAGSSSRGKRRLKGLERDADGNVVRYGAADDVTLSELVRQERAGQGINADEALATSISRMRGSFRESTLAGSRAGADEEADLDVRLLRGEEDRLTPAERRRRDLARAAAADARVSRADDSDPLNVMSPRFPRHLLVAVGHHWVLLAARGRALHPLQCLLVPREPGGAVASLDENVYAEGNAWRAAIHKAFAVPLPEGSAERAAEDAACGGWEPEPPVFCETVLDARPGLGRRTSVEVVPIPAEAAADAGIFFGKALADAEEDPTHAAVIHTQGKGLRRCVPPGFPYAHVGWAGGGMVHPIEDARTFSRSLLLDVAAGLLGVPPAAFGRRDQARPVSEGARAAEQIARRLLARGLTCADMAASAKLGAAVARVKSAAQ